MKANLEKGLIEQKLIKYKEKVLREMEEINLRKVEQVVYFSIYTLGDKR